MALTVVHAFVSAIADGADITLVRPTNWNANHTLTGSIDLSSADASGILAAARFPALTGDVTTVAGALAATIANDAVTYAKIQNVSATDRVLGRTSVGAGDIEEIATTGSGNVVRATSPTFVTPILGTPTSGTLTNATGLPEAGLSLTDITTANASATAHGFVPKWPNNTTTFFRGDGTYAVPAGAGDVVGDDVSTTAQNIVAYNTTAGKNITELTGTQGDVLYHNGTIWAKLAAGTSGNFLKTNGAGANPAWAAGGGGITIGAALALSAAPL